MAERASLLVSVHVCKGANRQTRTRNRLSFRESRAKPPFPRVAPILLLLAPRPKCSRTESAQIANITRCLSGKLRRPGGRRSGLRLCSAWLTDVTAETADAHWLGRTNYASESKPCLPGDISSNRLQLHGEYARMICVS